MDTVAIEVVVIGLFLVFEFEDVQAWRMGAVMENIFKDRWTEASNELVRFQIDLSEKIPAGGIISEGDLMDVIEEKCNNLIHEETNGIKAINDSELETFFKNRLIQKLRDQIENFSRDSKKYLRTEYLKYKHTIEKENGKFSDREFQRKILEGINKMVFVRDLNDQELNERFLEFWNSEDVINSPEVKTLKEIIKITKDDQKSMYKRYVKEGFEFALEAMNYQISVLSQFPYMNSIYHWDCDEGEFLSIRVKDDPQYFKPTHYCKTAEKIKKTMKHTKKIYMHQRGENGTICSLSAKGYKDENGNWHTSNGKLLVLNDIHDHYRQYTGSSNSIANPNEYENFMIELYTAFIVTIDENRSTRKNFEGLVNQADIRDLCVCFRQSVIDLATKYQILDYLRPKFVMMCVLFASFKMLLVRLNENNHQYFERSDPVTQLEMKKDYYKNLFILKLKGVQKGKIWQQQIVYHLKEAIIQMYFQINGSQATHFEVYQMIRNFSKRLENDDERIFPNLETYRQFRFCMYMQIMKDAKSESSKSDIFEKWKKICNYDMEPCEKEYIRSRFHFSMRNSGSTCRLLIADNV